MQFLTTCNFFVGLQKWLLPSIISTSWFIQWLWNTQIVSQLSSNIVDPALLVSSRGQFGGASCWGLFLIDPHEGIKFPRHRVTYFPSFGGQREGGREERMEGTEGIRGKKEPCGWQKQQLFYLFSVLHLHVIILSISTRIQHSKRIIVKKSLCESIFKKDLGNKVYIDYSVLYAFINWNLFIPLLL